MISKQIIHDAQVNAAETIGPLPTIHSEIPDNSPQSVGYHLQLPSGHEVRSYQKELAQPGIMGENYIFIAPTGSGKTLVSAIIICEHLKKVKELGENPKVVFSVTTRPLAEQQQKALGNYIGGAKVGCVVGDSGRSIKIELAHCDIVVCTSGKLLEELTSSRKSASQTLPSPEEDLNRITLLVMDECHNAYKFTVQAQLMHYYLKKKLECPQGFKSPQVIGLTASPGAGDNPNLEIEKTIDHLVNLCALLDATSGITTVKENVDELERYVNQPTLTQEDVIPRSESERFISLIKDEMAKIDEDKFVFPRWSQQYETAVKKAKNELEISTNEDFRDRISALKLLSCYHQSLRVYMELNQEHALKVLEDYSDLSDRDDVRTSYESILKRDFQNLVSNLKQVPPVPNPLLERAGDKILEQFSKASDSQGVFFVRTKLHAYAICDWIKSLSDFLRPQVITGQRSSENSQGMKQKEQKKVMKDFHSKKCNILVATSVVEEGIDVPACNFVIRFLHVSNEIAKVQAQGRARKEDSEVITIMSSKTKLSMKEVQNTERLELVNDVIKNDYWFPRGELFRTKLKEKQNTIIKALELKKRYKQQLRTAERDNIRIICRKCKTFACYGNEVFKVGESSPQYVVPSKDIMEKVVKKPHKDSGQVINAFSKICKIYCKKCETDYSWGITCYLHKEGIECAALNCTSFAFQEGDKEAIQVRSWSKAPYEPLPLEVYLWIIKQESEEIMKDSKSK